jgi:hypothetical protein
VRVSVLAIGRVYRELILIALAKVFRERRLELATRLACEIPLLNDDLDARANFVDMNTARA